MKRYELTKEQWEHVKAELTPERTGKRGRPRKDDQRDALDRPQMQIWKT
jgi:transposase